MDNKYFSRKFIITLLVMAAASAIPVVYHGAGVSDVVVLSVLGLMGAIGSAYHIANIKDPNAKPDDPKSNPAP